MKIEHIALWTKDIERLKGFYIKYFDATANLKYENKTKRFESYFLSFDSGCRLEIMQKSSIPDNKNDSIEEYIGLIHFAISVGEKGAVDSLTELLRSDGYTIISEPRTTGDGYYESVVLDPDENRIEITI
ncbi:VOC family protein [Bacillus solimangrovi]|uniref:VOC domain-containing protein n=1 Tax=Bacillus solimangrovi TaxID=1305675 RepID=A0A1E5LFD5_9BACI|nr:VOC family protein [Bacillus solimangrovi]OEH92784.1 hypothetical protein BFG57_01960 [Bacillus solimangrovi]